jgi:nucleoside-diphosphate-sugar epimerase
MKVAVTGASGFIGRILCPALRTAGHDVDAIDAREARCLRAVEQSDAVVHLAAIAHRHADSSEIRRVNVELPLKLARAAATGSACMVFLSSVKVHGDEAASALLESSPLAPADEYGESKALAEEALRGIPGLRLMVLRPPLVYGPFVRANFLAIMRAIGRGWPLPLASVRNRRSFIYVENLADAIMRSIGQTGTYLVSDGAPVSTPELCRRLGQALGRPARLMPFPAALLPRKLAGSLEIDDRAFRSYLGWSPPFGLDEGLRRTAQWYRGG